MLKGTLIDIFRNCPVSGTKMLFRKYGFENGRCVSENNFDIIDFVAVSGAFFNGTNASAPFHVINRCWNSCPSKFLHQIITLNSIYFQLFPIFTNQIQH